MGDRWTDRQGHGLSRVVLRLAAGEGKAGERAQVQTRRGLGRVPGELAQTGVLGCPSVTPRVPNPGQRWGPSGVRLQGYPICTTNRSSAPAPRPGCPQPPQDRGVRPSDPGGGWERGSGRAPGGSEAGGPPRCPRGRAQQRTAAPEADTPSHRCSRSLCGAPGRRRGSPVSLLCSLQTQYLIRQFVKLFKVHSALKEQ